jgi:hypothetical protein
MRERDHHPATLILKIEGEIERDHHPATRILNIEGETERERETTTRCSTVLFTTIAPTNHPSFF